MKDIRLQSITLENFKGQKNLTLELYGENASIYGGNATGKTTVYDSLTWLLFDKDSMGRSDFAVKPLNDAGEVLDHGAVTRVEAVLSVDHKPVRLQRTYFEKWSMKRGSASKTYDGNTSEYAVDGVPVQKNEYTQKIKDIVAEDLFRTLTNVSWFCAGLDQSKRRELLFDVCGVASDLEIMADAPEFQSLADALNGHTLDDYKKMLLAQRKSRNGARDTIPARLDECKRAADALGTLDFPRMRSERAACGEQLRTLMGETEKRKNGTLLSEKRNALEALCNQRAAYQNKNLAHRNEQVAPVQDERPAIQKEIDRTTLEFDRLTELAQGERERINDLEKAIEACRTDWEAENSRIFSDTACPTCGQAMPAALLVDAKRRFDQEQAERKSKIIALADWYKVEKIAVEKRLAEHLKTAADLAENLTEKKVELAAYVPDAVPQIFNLPGYDVEMERYNAEIQMAEAQVSALENEAAEATSELNDQIRSMEDCIAALDRELAKESTLASLRQREADLKRDAQAAAQELEDIDRMLFQCEEFQRYKVQFIEESVNEKFALAQFRLFKTQVNGGLADCCDVLYQGVPYGSLNNGMKINIGIDVIRTLSLHYGIRVPLFIDNAESVVELADAGTQTIRLVVSAGDAVLRCETEPAQRTA